MKEPPNDLRRESAVILGFGQWELEGCTRLSDELLSGLEFDAMW